MTFNYQYKHNHPYNHYQSDISSQSQFTQNNLNNHDNYPTNQQCLICVSKGLILWIKSISYAKQNSYRGIYRKTINNILSHKNPQTKTYYKNYIDFKQSLLYSKQNSFSSFQYKQFKQIIYQIKNSIFNNLNNHQHYDKLYFGQFIHYDMIKYKYNKKVYKQNIQQIQSQNQKYQQQSSSYKPKFIVNKSALSTDQEDKILQDSTFNRKYDFYPVQILQRQQQYNKSRQQMSKLEISYFEIQKLKRNLSIMINEIKLNEQSYPQTKNILKPFIDFSKTKQQLKFRKRCQQISQIHEQNKYKKSPNQYRLYTSPDPQDDPYNDMKYANAYELLLQNPELKKKKKRSLLRRQPQRQKSMTNISKNNISRNKLNTNKFSRMNTEQSSNLIISGTNNSTTIGSRKSKSKSKLKGTTSSTNKLLLATSSSRNKLKSSNYSTFTSDKSVNKSKKLLTQYKR